MTKNTSHDTKDCFYNKSIKNKTRFNNKGTDEYTKKDLDELRIVTKSGINLNSITLTGRINNKSSSFNLDSETSRNFISKEMIQESKLGVKEDVPVEVKFANNESETSNHSVLVKLELDKLIYEKSVKLYVLQKGPKEIILGNEFLHGNGLIINYKLGIIQYEQNSIIFYDHNDECDLLNYFLKKLS
ncbi:pol polyprotein [Vairimorpha apis BRL 01]|uniref:Pol polyprotein n=1 Tax=Vairimorpha apis BRL 01 TaxID=1037528 RepID=T0M9T9_9MICR|nr:pol polyprotein [Vairimorpha apis BRL 01]